MCIASSILEKQVTSGVVAVAGNFDQISISKSALEGFKSTMIQVAPYIASGPSLYQESSCSNDDRSSENESLYHHDCFDQAQVLEASRAIQDDIVSLEEENELFATRRPYRSVHFDVDAYDAIIEYHYKYPKNECADSYTTGDEESDNAIQLRRECRHIKKRNVQLIHRLNHVYENEEYANDINVFNDWVSSDVRGFESKFLSESEFQVQAYVQSAVICYRRLQHILNQASYDEIFDDRDDILRSHIMKKSQRSSEIAIRLAADYEIEAQKQ